MYELSPKALSGMHVHLVGAKGTGVSALAELLVSAGAIVSGSDVSDPFYTEEVLKAINVPVGAFSEENITKSIDLVIHSAAYNAETNPELKKATILGIPIMNYPEALGSFSKNRDSSGICGVHGKTTTTALAGTIAKALALPSSILAGSAVTSFGNRSTLNLGSKYFIAETCEYRRHFLNFHPKRIVLTSVESDHEDYYPDYESIVSGFMDYIALLPKNGKLIYCSDHPGAVDVVQRAKLTRPDIVFIPYGFKANGSWQILNYKLDNGKAIFKIAAFDKDFVLHVPGVHIALDATAAIALCCEIEIENDALSLDKVDAIASAIDSFSGSKRRSEIIGNANNILFIDDYAHHPSEIKTTLRGLKEFYPNRRLVVDFMSHTYTRTAALFDDFASAFADADFAILHKIYPSARDDITTNVTGQKLYEKIKQNGVNAVYFEEVMDAFPFLLENLKPMDLFVTLGAGDNWRVGKALFSEISSKGK